tara:strand:+ start:945 stop:1112 length:168 start_codon:yes stop_codon:yes gene_type:complete
VNCENQNTKLQKILKPILGLCNLIGIFHILSYLISQPNEQKFSTLGKLFSSEGIA